MGAPVLLLHHTGAKSGKERDLAAALHAGRGARVVVASKGGYTKHPAWFHNLMANPDTAVELPKKGKVAVHARKASPEERNELWPRVVGLYSGYADYQQSTDREIPVVVLDRRNKSKSPVVGGQTPSRAQVRGSSNVSRLVGSMRLLAAGTTLLLALLAAGPATAAPVTDRDVYAEVTDDRVVLGNSVAERTWSRSALATVELRDKRRGGFVWSQNQPDFRLSLGGPSLTSEQFAVTDAEVETLPRGGLRVTMQLQGPAGLSGTRIAEAYPRIAGFRTQTVLVATTGLAIAGATLDEAAVGDKPAVTLHNLRAGADWRSPDYEGPPISVGDPQAGTWRATTAGSARRGRSRRTPSGSRRTPAAAPWRW